jgi:hypothetical protein
LLDFATPVNKPSEEWSKKGLEDKLVRFIVETDQVNYFCCNVSPSNVREIQALQLVDRLAFRELLLYQRPKTKESDIPHRTDITQSVLSCAEDIQEELKKELQVRDNFQGKKDADMQ